MSNWRAKVGSQEIPGLIGKFGLGVQNEAGQRLRVLPREHIGHSKCSLPTTQETVLYMDITKWSVPKSDWLYYLYWRWRNSVQSVKTRPGVDCVSDHELLIAKFRLKLNVRNITRPFWYDLNQICYNYTVEVTNRSKGLYLIDKVPEDLRVEVHNAVQDVLIKTIPMKKKWKKGKWLSEEALQIADKWRGAKGGNGEKER